MGVIDMTIGVVICPAQGNCFKKSEIFFEPGLSVIYGYGSGCMRCHDLIFLRCKLRYRVCGRVNIYFPLLCSLNILKFTPNFVHTQKSWKLLKFS